MGRITLKNLPLPPSRNELEAIFHPIEKGKQKNRYRRELWAKALNQAKPFHDPPAHVRMKLLFRVKKEHDPDNLDVKWILDTLGQRQLSDWRQGIAESKGFYVDDSPRHLSWLPPVQEVSDKPRLEIIMEWDDA